MGESTFSIVNKGTQLGKGRGAPNLLESQVVMRAPEEEVKASLGPYSEKLKTRVSDLIS